MGAFEGKYSGLQAVGIYKEDLKKIDLIVNPEKKRGDIDNFNGGISIGKGVANSLGIGIDQNLRLISPDGLKTLFGTTPRIGDFPVKYVFKVGRYDIDRYRIYMPLFDAQMFFNNENQIAISYTNPKTYEVAEIKVEGEKYLDEILLAGSEKANKIASKKIIEIKKIIGF